MTRPAPWTRESLSTLLACWICFGPGPAGLQAHADTCTPAPDGLVSWWAGDGNADDLAGDNDGVALGGATFTSGRVHEAFTLDGINGFVFLGNPPGLQLSNGDFTIELWVLFNSLQHPPGENIGAPPGDMSLVDKMSGSATVNNTDGWRLVKQHDDHFWFCLGGNGGNGCTPTGPTTVRSSTVATVGTWFHVVGVKSSVELAIYVNGVKEESKPAPPFTDTHSTDLNIGMNALQLAHPNGLLDEVSIYDRALTEAEVSMIFNAGDAGKCKQLMITTDALPALQLGDVSSRQLEATYGTQPYVWSVVAGALPPGMSLTADGVFGGIPTELGEFTVTVRVADDDGDFADKEFTVKVSLVLPPPDIRVEKVGTTAVPGRTLEYYIVLQNVGESRATGVRAAEFLEPWFTLVGTSPDPESTMIALDPFPPDLPDPAEYEALIQWVVPELQPGQTEVLTYSAELDPEFPVGQPVTGTVCLPTGPEVNQCLEEWGSCVLTCAAFLIELFPPCVATFCSALLDECFIEAYSCESDEQISTQPVDPNEKCVAAELFIQPDRLLVYPIHFENIGDIEALDVFVTDVLDPDLDESTLQILTPGGSYDSESRTLSWDLLGINLQPQETGSVVFSIKPVPGLPSGTVIANRAEIQFEIFETIATRVCGSEVDEPGSVVNIIDTTPPTCQMQALPVETETLDFTIAWSGADAIGEIESFAVFGSVNGGVFSPIEAEAPASSVVFAGESATQYEFLCVARDTAGNVEQQVLGAEAMTVTCTDQDGDRFCGAGDCDESDTTTHVNAPEINDGLDNQCPGETGYGAIDEITGLSGFFNPDDRNELSWTAQPGATLYEAARSTLSDFSAACALFSTAEAVWVDAFSPAPGQVLHYLVRAAAPHGGSWGLESTGGERTVDCAAP